MVSAGFRGQVKRGIRERKMFSTRETSIVGRWLRGTALRWLLATAFGLTAAGALAAASVATSAIDSIVVKLRDGVIPDPAAGLPASERTALSGAIKVPFSHVGYTRDGALKLQLLNPLALDAARAAVNRARLLPEVLYANVVPAASAISTNAAVPSGAAQQPPVRRLIVKFRDAETSAAARRNQPPASALVDRLSALAGQPIAHQRAMSGGSHVVSLFEALPISAARALAALLSADATIEYAEPDLLMQPMLVPNDPSYPNQWHYMSPPAEMGGANLPPAWDLTTGATSIVIAVIDSGILSAHPDLAGRIVGGYDFISDANWGNDGDGRDADPSDPGDWVTVADTFSASFAGCAVRNSSFHGSHVAGTIGASTGNLTGVAGINWVSLITPVRVLGKCGGSTSDLVDAIRWAAGVSVPNAPDNPNPARVLNMSLGGSGSCPNSMQSSIDEAIAAGAVVVVSAGNSGVDAIDSSPSGCDGVITVSATGRAGQLASYSNFGTVVEISAPGGSDGEGVLSTVNDSATAPALGSYAYAYYQGTSMAAPHVAGIASLMLSRNPSLTPAQVMSKIQTTARAFPAGTIRDCSTALCGAGIIDAAAAVAAAVQTATTTTLTSAANPAAAGASVAFTATVAGPSGAPTGTVKFADAGTVIGGCNAVPLAAGTAECSTSSLASGNHGIVATYGGDAVNAPSNSTTLVQVINLPPFANGVPMTGLSGSIGTELRYTLTVPAGAIGLSFKIAGGTGDADLYVRFGSAPTSNAYDCRPYLSGNNETCTIATSQAGTYHVMVRGYTAFSGVSLTGSYSIGPANVAPVANFSFTTSGLTANFADGSTDSDGSIASRSWSFGDSTTSTATNPTKTYAAAGTYGVTLTVTDNAGAPNSVTKSVTVSAANVAPTANFSYTASGLTASFTDSSTDSDGSIVSRSWNFGDTTTSTATNPSKTYAAAGTYNVTLTVTDNASGSNSTTKSVTVNPVSPLPNTLTNGVPVTGLSGSAATELRYTMAVPAGATGLNFKIAGGTGDADLYVRFGSAPTTTTYDCRPYLSSSNETCTIATAQAGTYHVMVRGYSAFSGISLTGSYSTGPTNVAPTANFSFTTSGLIASFTDSSTDSDGSIASRSWSFGDSTTSTATNPTKTYAAAGTYNVTLTVTDNGSATSSTTKPVTVSAAPPPSSTLTNGVPVTGLSGSAGTELRYTMAIPAGAAGLTFTIAGGTGDADLYVRFGSAPTTTTYDCRPYLSSNNETCTIATAQSGTYHVMVRGYSAFSGVSLTGKY